jgi:preprotein translocase subunit SecD
MSGENLIDAQPSIEQSNQRDQQFHFTLDRVGAKRFGKATYI